MAETAKQQAERVAAERRADYLRALESEKAGLKQRGLDERVKQVDAEIARVKKAPAGRGSSGDSQTS